MYRHYIISLIIFKGKVFEEKIEKTEYVQTVRADVCPSSNFRTYRSYFFLSRSLSLFFVLIKKQNIVSITSSVSFHTFTVFFSKLKFVPIPFFPISTVSTDLFPLSCLISIQFKNRFFTVSPAFCVIIFSLF